jgi:hypothetical protein
MPEVISTSIARELGAGALARELGALGRGAGALARELGALGRGAGALARELGALRTSPGEGFGGDARRGIAPEDRDLTLSGPPNSSRFDAPRGITGIGAFGDGRVADAIEVKAVDAASPRDLGVAAAAADTFDAPEGISEGGRPGRSTHERGTPGADAPRGIAGDPYAPELSVEWAARVFARAFADRLGARLVGTGHDPESA